MIYCTRSFYLDRREEFGPGIGMGGYLGRGQGLMGLGEVGRIGRGYMTGQVGWTLRKRGMRKNQDEPQ